MNTTSSTIQSAIARILGSKRSGIPSSTSSASSASASSASGPLKMPSLSMPSLSMPSLPSFSSSSAGFASAYSSASSASSAEGGSYFLRVIFYVFMYGFIGFLILILVHFTITPVFRFSPGDKGLIGIPGTSDSLVYWNNRVQPPPDDPVPKNKDDSLSGYSFVNKFSFSVDLYVRRLIDTAANKRIILYKADSTDVSGGLTESSGQDLSSHMQQNTSMILYLSDTNNLGLTFFCGASGTPYSIREIKNIPLYTPFRITVVVEDRLFTIYLNGRHVFQRIVPNVITSNSNRGGVQKFYSAPTWANNPSKTIFVQNFQVWPRAIRLSEVQSSLPALASVADFKASPEAGTPSSA